MASILDRYAIKEVADVTFYEIDSNGNPTHPVLYLDTLKVSTIEQTAENTEARGGKGNAALVSWDYNKEINVTLEDALFSAKSMQIMYGGDLHQAEDGNFVLKTEIFKPAAANSKFTKPDATVVKYTTAAGVEVEGGPSPTSLDTKETYFVTYKLKTKAATVIEISANSFPGTYYIIGDTYARSDAAGRDEFFQFIIPKAKVTSENTLTLEAEGEPTVFNMSLRVLRPADGQMLKLVKYDVFTTATGKDAGDAITDFLGYGDKTEGSNIPAPTNA